MQLNHINCESTDRESDTEKAVSVNTINVQDDYETLRHEQPFHSHVYEKQLELLLNYPTRTRNNNIPIEQNVNEATTSNEPETEQEFVLVQITFTNTYQKNHQEKQFGQFHFS